MTPQLQIAFPPETDRVSRAAQEARLCLVLASAGLSALAAMSPTAQGVIEEALDEAIGAGLVQGETAGVLALLRNQIIAGHDTEAERVSLLEAALIRQAEGLLAQPGAGNVVSLG